MSKKGMSGVELEKHLLKFFNKSLSPKIKKEFDFNIELSVHDIKTEEYPDSKIYTIFIDTEPYKLLDVPKSVREFIYNETGSFLEYLGIPWSLQNIHLNKRVLKREDEQGFIHHRWLREEKKELPFDEKVKGNVKERIFSENTDEMELKWHWDEQDRIVTPLHKTDWMLQLDNELPVKLIEGNEYFIPVGVYHRVIKGNGDLKIKVKLL
jgi:hypothetical protein